MFGMGKTLKDRVEKLESQVKRLTDESNCKAGYHEWGMRMHEGQPSVRSLQLLLFIT